MSEWGGSGIEKSTFDYIAKIIKHGSIFVELGAGRVSTRELSKLFNLYSVEQDEQYCNIYPTAKYIHAKITNGWYDVEAVNNGLPKSIAAMLVDGPSGSGNRDGLLQNLEIFDFSDDAVIIFHDTYRAPERDLANKFAAKLGMKSKEYSGDDHFIVVSNREDI